ncbi:cytochrome bc complex cytochrome b subunit [Gammaproteobacteria bacterium]|jgi:ubiquinol-cytochrome c reductase cytochrome b subunit|nr:cytochrome bc complex cytochrome b subunit [Gammaproteobacteria bacterium]MDA9204633.1 cytochrome bc complex cytochrome b subunit [Gammaproteobacteria bacterium]MDA9259085.1 cytochrome bc complex cytochrome b subunit [Gammaproteobacteria bacterium]MDA9269182.1 cytochrome bc complex cytochrome b subunit [Gammaproteobacteria bacterium]MDA9292496.1 cytochrome bc complex cytochrome b subunit [Gammaproteobacteria bacterium]
MSNQSSGIFNWVNDRLPIKNTYERHLSKHPVPKKVNFWYLFGALALVVLIIQIVSGIWLMFGYENTEEGAFASVEYIMRDVDYGWVVRYMHTTGASMFFAVVYLHMFRGLMYGSYHKPRELVWIFGMTIYLVMMAEGFLGYVLPYGQMSYWGAQVIISLFGAIPFIGESLELWVRGDYYISGATISRFFALHVVALPLILIALVFMHLVALHEVGAGNPEGVDIEKYVDEDGVPLDSVPFFPYKILNALVAIGIFGIVFSIIMFFFPEGGGYMLELANFEEANPLSTPDHIAPVWYYSPYYAMLRAIPDKLGGLIVMGAAIAILFVVPWLDRSKAASIRYKGNLSKIAMTIFVISWLMLAWLGTMPVTELRTTLSQIGTVIYFAFFLLMPVYTSIEKSRPVPERL